MEVKSKASQPSGETKPTTSATAAGASTASSMTPATTSTAAAPGSGAVTISNCSHHSNCCCPVKKPPPKKKTVVKKAAPALTDAEIDRMIDLGLGRGIDATDLKPWANKSSFQVRRVTAEGVIGTEEGGSVQSYERSVSSVVTHQTSMKAAVVVPQAPVEIGMDAEQSRSVSSTRRTLGRKVVNRSISFLSDFKDIPLQHIESDVLKRFLRDSPKSKTEVSDDEDPPKEKSVADVHREFPTFEQRLSKWIVNRILERQEIEAHDIQRRTGEKVTAPKFVRDQKYLGDPLAVLVDFVYVANDKEKKKIIHDCYDFIKHFQITHYVSSIDLGALEYRYFTETDFNTTIGAGGTLAIEKLVNLSFAHKTTSRKFRKASDLKTVGKMSTDGKVSRGTHDEAVVGIKVQPISTLVKFPYLQLSLKRALVYYIEEQGDSSSGPFLVAYGSERSMQYWTVDDDCNISGTRNRKNASFFFIVSSESGKHPYEFHIAYKGDGRRALRKRVSALTPLNERSINPIPRYLDADVSVFGTNSGPLRLEYHVSERSRLLLFGRVANEKGPINPDTWAQGQDFFFINCARRRMKKDGYVAMRRTRTRNDEERWITSCFPSREYHNERNKYMLFRLLPGSYRDEPQEPPPPTPNVDADGPFDEFSHSMSLDEKLEQYQKGSAPEAFRAPPSPVPPKQATNKMRLSESPPPTTNGGDTLLLPEIAGDLHHLMGSDASAEATSRV